MSWRSNVFEHLTTSMIVIYSVWLAVDIDYNPRVVNTDTSSQVESSKGPVSVEEPLVENRFLSCLVRFVLPRLRVLLG